MKLGELCRLVAFDASRALGTVRWFVVPVVMFLVGLAVLDQVTFDYIAQRPRDPNFWDVPLSVMPNVPLVLFVIVLGFILVTGDLYIRDRNLGTAAQAVIRASSRATWWTAKLLSLGVLALVFAFTTFLCMLLAGAISVPVELGASPDSGIPWGNESALYPRYSNVPIALFVPLITLYTALALWAVGAVVLGASLLYPKMVTPLGVGFAWVMISWIISPIYARRLPGTLDPMYQVSYVVHFDSPNFTPTSWTISLLIIGATLATVLILGVLRLRKVDL